MIKVSKKFKVYKNVKKKGVQGQHFWRSLGFTLRNKDNADNVNVDKRTHYSKVTQQYCLSSLQKNPDGGKCDLMICTHSM